MMYLKCLIAYFLNYCVCFATRIDLLYLNRNINVVYYYFIYYNRHSRHFTDKKIYPALKIMTIIRIPVIICIFVSM